MKTDNYLEQSLCELGALYSEMAEVIEPPAFVDVGGYNAWRYEDRTESLACFLKGIKAVSSLNASMVLLKAGHVQEIGAICRMIDDFCNEIMFLVHN